jgi:hypothetical protein
MTYEYSATTLHRADLDRQIDALRTERMVAASTTSHDRLVDRARRGIGNLLVATGTALIGREPTALRTHRA